MLDSEIETTLLTSGLSNIGQELVDGTIASGNDALISFGLV